MHGSRLFGAGLFGLGYLINSGGMAALAAESPPGPS